MQAILDGGNLQVFGPDQERVARASGEVAEVAEPAHVDARGGQHALFLETIVSNKRTRLLFVGRVLAR